MIIIFMGMVGVAVIRCIWLGEMEKEVGITITRSEGFTIISDAEANLHAINLLTTK